MQSASSKEVILYSETNRKKNCIVRWESTDSALGQYGGCDSRRPEARKLITSQLSTSGYGPTPLVISSHKTTPNDHCQQSTKQSVYWKLTTGLP